ncbi:hypothetical protein [Pseudarthrobacter sp. B4EP4b]|uniref:hypothetical protein n=1 Tax=Pseudarthrobacter sp. B4EP4b TaxID=2590664 RepID=UPI00114D64E9|nr:hypothetical protein [Pseudarthrobacter sp. B4EP4b]
MRYAHEPKRTTSAPSPGAEVLPPGYRRTPDWSVLKTGDSNIIRSGDHPTVTGQVDALTSDGSLLWVLPDGGQPRKIYYRSDDPELWSSHHRSS